MKAIYLTETGGPEVMQWVDVDLPPPGPGEVRVHATAVGLNFIDTYHRTGLYPNTLPLTLGMVWLLVIMELVYVMTGGNFKTSVIGMEFWNFYSDVNYGTASAIVVILMIAIIPIMIFQVRQFRREEAMR